MPRKRFVMLRVIITCILLSVLFSVRFSFKTAAASTNPSAYRNSLSNAVSPQSVYSGKYASTPSRTAADIQYSPLATTPTQSVQALPLSFVANAGQVNSAIHYQAQGGSTRLFFTNNDVIFVLPTGIASADGIGKGERPLKLPTVSYMHFIAANATPTITGTDRLVGIVNFYNTGRNGEAYTDVPSFGGVSYVNLYPGIHAHYDGATGTLKSTYTVDANADATALRWRYSNLSNVTLDADGNLRVSVVLPIGVIDAPPVLITEKAPTAWQMINGVQVSVPVGYTLAADKSVGFSLGTYNHGQPLIIDPTFTYSTYLGGSGNDTASDVTVDNAGNAYVVGTTASTGFYGVTGTRPSNDVFVVKITQTGSGAVQVAYTTYFGGTGDDYGYGVAVDPDGNAYVTGMTASTTSSFPTTSNAYKGTFGGGAADAYVAKLGTTNGQIQYLTYLGSGGDDRGYGIAVNPTTKVVYVTGSTTSAAVTAFGKNGFQPTNNGGTDAFVAVLDPAVAGINGYIYSTYVGGNGDDAANDVTVDTSGSIYLTGKTNSVIGGSKPFPTANSGLVPIRSSANDDVFVTKINPNASGIAQLVYSSYFGGSTADDLGNAIVLDTSNNIYVTGRTYATNFPTAPSGSVYQPSKGSNGCGSANCLDAFAAKINPSAPTASQLVYSTYLGGNGTDVGFGIVLDGLNNAFITGQTGSSNFPTLNNALPNQTSLRGSFDAFIIELSSTGTTALFSTYLGGTASDSGQGIAFDGHVSLYIAGNTNSTDFPTLAPSGMPPQTQAKGSNDAFLTKLTIPDIQAPSVPTNVQLTALSPTSVSLAWTAATDNVGVTSYVVRQGVAPVCGTTPLCPTGTSYTVTGLSPSTTYNFSIVAKDAAGNTSGVSNTVTATTPAPPDTQPPSAPTNVQSANVTQTSVTLSWTASTDNVGVTGYTVLQGGSPICPVNSCPNGTTTTYTVTGLAPSTGYTFNISAKDAAGNVSAASNTARVTTLTPPDTQAPTAPMNVQASTVTATNVTLNWSASNDNVGVVKYLVLKNSVDICSGSNQCPTGTMYTVPNLTPQTTYTFTVKAVDAAGNVSAVSAALSVTTTVAPDTQPPTVPTNLYVTGTTETTISVMWDASSDNVGVTSYAILQGNTPVGTTTQTTFTVTGLSANTQYSLTVSAKDAAGNVSPASSSVTVTTQPLIVLPPDPKTIASPTNQTRVSDLCADTKFLFSGTNPIQTGLDPAKIECPRITVLYGKVLKVDGTALSGARVSVVGHGEYGQTISRADGMFDFVVTGGGTLTVNFEKNGFLTVQRQVETPWHDYVLVPTVRLTSLDNHVKQVALATTSTQQVVQGSQITDSRGTRQATLFFPSGTTATMVLPNGSSQPITNAHVRATEYTVGPNGSEAMPATLPPTSAYTYAVEFSVDEAQSAGATTVNFSKPVISYNENFLDFPVGTTVPSGYYDRLRGQWLASANGQIIKIVGITNGLADIGTGNGTTLTALGITDEERQQLAGLYSVGKTLWRVPLMHFTPCDLNWSGGFPLGDEKFQPQSDTRIEDTCLRENGTIECQNQTLRQMVSVTGTPFQLHYESDRVLGRAANYTLTTLLTQTSNDGGVNASMLRIDVAIDIAGRTFNRTYSPSPDLKDTFTWDGKDKYERLLNGAQPVSVRVAYVFPGSYMTTNGFTAYGAEVITSSSGTATTVSIIKHWNTTLGAFNTPRDSGFGGWALNIQHAYDPAARILYRGDGERQSALNVGSVIVPGSAHGTLGNSGTSGIVAAPDGNVYVSAGTKVFQLQAEGSVRTIAGTGTFGYAGDNGLATNASLHNVTGLALDKDGNLYVAQDKYYYNGAVVIPASVRAVIPANKPETAVITTVVGDPTSSAQSSGDGGSAINAKLIGAAAVVTGKDGSLFIADGPRIRRVDAFGTITTIAGTGGFCTSGACGDGGLAKDAQLLKNVGLAVGSDGSLYIADGSRVRCISPGGTIRTVAGGGTPSSGNGDGGSATQAFLTDARSIAVDRTDNLYIIDALLLRKVDSSGTIITIAGGGDYSPTTNGDGGSATSARLVNPVGVAVVPNGTIYIADSGVDGSAEIRVLQPPLPGFTYTDIAITSKDGKELYHFDAMGLHIDTRDAVTGTILYTFSYDTLKRLVQITDRDGKTTTITRDGSGKATAITGVFGQQTTLGLNANNYLTQIGVNPAAEYSFNYTYTSDGLLTQARDPQNGTTGQYTYTYTPETGRLARADGPNGTRTSLVRTDFSPSFTDIKYKVEVTNARNDKTTYVIERPVGEAPATTTTAPNNATTSIRYDAKKGAQIITDAAGVVTRVYLAPDPRWGMQAPYAALVTKQTGTQPFYTMTASRDASLRDPVNLLSLTRQQDTTTVNGRTTTMVYSNPTGTPTLILTNPAGEVTTTTLNAQNRSDTVLVSNLATRHYQYNSYGQMTQQTEVGEFTRSTTWDYDPQGYVAHQIRAGVSVAFTNDWAGRVLTQQLPTGQILTNTYNIVGNLITAINLQGIQTTYDYDANNRRTSMTLDPGGQGIRTEYTYDVASNLSKVVKDAGNDKINAQTTIEYTPIGSCGDYAISIITDPIGGVTSTQYTIFDAPWNVTDPMGRVTHYDYTPQGWQEYVTSPGNHRTRTVYDSEGRIASVVDPRGTTTSYGYDAASRLATVAIGSEQVRYGYDANGRLNSITAPSNNASLRNYDSFSRMTRSVDPIGNSTTYNYDAFDRVTQSIVGANASSQQLTTTYNYDSVGRLQAQTVGGFTTSYGYTPLSGNDTWNLQTVTDPRGNNTRYAYNTLGLVATTTDAANGTWAFTYDNLGRLTAQADPMGANHGTSYGYDSAGRKTSANQGGRGETWAYNADNSVASYTNYSGHQTVYGYSAAADGRLTSIGYNDANTPNVTFSYDAAGNLLQMNDGGQTTYGYDGYGHLQSRSRNGRTVNYGYTFTGQLDHIDYWGQGQIQYGYNAADQLTVLRPWANSNVQVTPTSYTYRSTGLLDSQTRGNGTKTTYSYDGASRLTDVTHTQASQAFKNFHYAFDANSNRTQLSDSDGTTNYGTYDALNRMGGVSYPAVGGTPAQSISYGLDSVGNRTSAAATTYSYDDHDQITNNGFSYDANGNLTNDGSATYTYDAAQRLIRVVKGATTTQYAYDGRGNLVQETINGVSTEFVLDEQDALPRILGEIHADGSQRLYAYGPDGLAAQKDIGGSSTQYLLYAVLDGQGSLRHLVDDTGTLVFSRSYDAFGNVRATSGTAQTRMGYTGELMGQADDTIYLRARHYLPNLGRFLQRDSFGGNIANPQTFNRYSYVGHNPASMSDPSGHMWFVDWAFGLFDAGKLLYDVLQGNEKEYLADFAAVGVDIAGGFLPTPPGASVAARAGVHGLEGARAAGEGARVIGDSARLVGDGSHLGSSVLASKGFDIESLGRTYSKDAIIEAFKGSTHTLESRAVLDGLDSIIKPEFGPFSLGLGVYGRTRTPKVMLIRNDASMETILTTLVHEGQHGLDLATEKIPAINSLSDVGHLYAEMRGFDAGRKFAKANDFIGSTHYTLSSFSPHSLAEYIVSRYPSLGHLSKDEIDDAVRLFTNG